MEHKDKRPDHSVAESARFRELAPAIEFMCWIVLLLAPILRWINGAAVTTDQLIMQVVLTSVAGVGALVLRFYNWRERRQSK